MEMSIKTMIEMYGALGAGGACVILMIWVVVRFINHIIPRLSKIESLLAAHQEVIKNNTDAIHEVSRSNDNVAKALTLLENTTKQMVHLLSRHDIRAEAMERELSGILEVIRDCHRGK